MRKNNALVLLVILLIANFILSADVNKTHGRTPKYVAFEKAPVLINRVVPIYPRFAREEGVQGVVILDIEILTDGTVGTVEVFRSLSPELDEEAVKAVRQWTFKPAQYKGEPIAVWMQMPVKFGLSE